MIVIINPNATTSMTDAMVKTARKAVPNTEFVGWTSTKGPASIQGEADGLAAVPPLLELVKKASDQGASAIIIGCFDDIGLAEARAIASCPVIGVGQAAYHVATLFGPRFSVVTTLTASVPVLAANLQAHGFEGNLGRIRPSGVPVLALEDDRENATRTILAEIQAAIDEDNIDCVVLGCAGMVHIVEEGRDLPTRLVDGVWAAAKLASLA